MASQEIIGMIPSSIQRIRCFMIKEGRLKLKPWADVDETLDAFYGLLAANRDNDGFWQGIRVLLGDISKDVKRRLATRNKPIDNEVLDTTRYDELLMEIREASALRPRGRGSFLDCAHSLSAPAVSLLLLLGGAASLGCGDTKNNDTDTSGMTSTDTNQNKDSSSEALDTESEINTSDDGSSDSAAKSLEEIVAATTLSETQQQAVLDCIDDLHESWQTGLEELFQNETEDEILNQLQCLMYGNSDLCGNPDGTGEYDLQTLLDNCSVAIYIGVRFE